MGQPNPWVNPTFRCVRHETRRRRLTVCAPAAANEEILAWAVSGAESARIQDLARQIAGCLTVAKQALLCRKAGRRFFLLRRPSRVLASRRRRRRRRRD